MKEYICCESHKRKLIEDLLHDQYKFNIPDTVRPNFKIKIDSEDSCLLCKRWNIANDISK